MFTALAPPMGLKLVVDEVVRVHVADEHDVAPAPAIAAVGAAPRLVFLAAKGDAAAPAVTGREFHHAFVDKHAGKDAEPRAFAKGWMLRRWRVTQTHPTPATAAAEGLRQSFSFLFLLIFLSRHTRTRERERLRGKRKIKSSRLATKQTGDFAPFRTRRVLVLIIVILIVLVIPIALGTPAITSTITSKSTTGQFAQECSHVFGVRPVGRTRLEETREARNDTASSWRRASAMARVELLPEPASTAKSSTPGIQGLSYNALCGPLCSQPQPAKP